MEFKPRCFRWRMAGVALSCGRLLEWVGGWVRQGFKLW